MKASQITTAETLGMVNHENGIMRVPAQSKDLMEMLKGRTIGQTPQGEASTKDLMNAWTNGWDKAKRIEMKLKFGF